MTRIIGLTGGIACGKSTFSRFLIDRGVPVIDCDKIAKEIVEPGTFAYNRIALEFGDGILNDDDRKTLDRRKLGEIVFKDSDKMKRLMNIQGPVLFFAIFKRLAYAFAIGTPLVVVDAPTLFESKFLLMFIAKTVVVAAPESTMVKRMTERDNLSEKLAKERIRAQIPIDEKVQMADYVVYNTADIDNLERHVDRLVLEWKKKYCRGLSRFWCAPTILIVIAMGIVCFKKFI